MLVSYSSVGMFRSYLGGDSYGYITGRGGAFFGLWLWLWLWLFRGYMRGDLGGLGGVDLGGGGTL